MTIFDLLTLIFGLSLFLFGMTLMGDTLKKSAGGKLKIILGKLTDSPLKGFALGFAVTAIIQSSSATTVMVVGFVNSGTMLLSQAVGVIMGANVGTTVTSWLTALSGIGSGGAVNSVMQWFKPSTFTPVIALVGLLLYMAGKN
ncbi:MAG: Na/Pi symporter, partial [Clostridia bacterium]|nr:Na/Pi symporter [Clostridia bacterium]